MPPAQSARICTGASHWPSLGIQSWAQVSRPELKMPADANHSRTAHVRGPRTWRVWEGKSGSITTKVRHPSTPGQESSSLNSRISMDGAIFSCRTRYTASAMGMSTSNFWFMPWMPWDPVNPSATMSISRMADFTV